MRRRFLLNLDESEVAIQGHRGHVVTIHAQGEAPDTIHLQRLPAQGLHQYTSEATPPRLRRNNDAAEMCGIGFGPPVLAEAKAVVMRVQQYPARADLQFQGVGQAIRRQRKCDARPCPALGGGSRIKPARNGGVVR
ncbi:hypothetical protein D3C73_1194110 [compost metagenome]